MQVRLKSRDEAEPETRRLASPHGHEVHEDSVPPVMASAGIRDGKLYVIGPKGFEMHVELEHAEVLHEDGEWYPATDLPEGAEL